MHFPSLLLASVTIATANAFCEGPTDTGNSTIIPGTSCTAECSIDRPGGDFRAGIETSSLADCAATCLSDEACLTAQFIDNRPNGPNCYLKNFINEAAPAEVVDSVVCRTCAPNQPVPGTRCVQECSTDRPGNDIDLLRIEGVNALLRCAEACERNPNCVTAQYRHDNLFCYLKERANDPVANDNVDGIVCSKTADS